MDDISSLLDTAFWASLGAIFALLLLSAFFSGSETALTAASRGKLRAQADRGESGAAQALKITEDSERLIGSVLLGNNLVNILATSLATALLTRMFGQGGMALFLATTMMTLLILIFAEVLPKTYAISNSERAASRVARPIGLVVEIFDPIVTAVRALVRGILRLFGVQTDPDSQIMSVHEEIAGALALGHQEGVVEKEHRDRLLGALDLNDRDVEEIMLHRSEIEVIDADAPAEDVITQCLQSRYTRLPVYREDPENIVGVLHAKDLFRAVEKTLRSGDTEQLSDFNIMDVVREPYFTPETTALDEQMRQFLAQHTHFALVVDEYGALQGMITLEDILEEIVGEITDEFDTSDEIELTPEDDGSYLIDGATTIRDLNRIADWSLPDEEANTVAGLVIHEAQSIPTVGQVFSFHGFRFEVVERNDNRLTKLKLRPL